MRLDKLTIGSAKDSTTHQFKNLKNVTIDFDQDHWVTVVIGWNGTGKSNVLEALAIIFRDLIAEKRISEFAFKLVYRIGSGDETKRIHIDADPDRVKDPLVVHVLSQLQTEQHGHTASLLDFDTPDNTPKGELIKLKTFFDNESIYLPRYVFSYYSGESSRMHEIFHSYLENYDGKLRRGVDPGMKRLFYALPVHSQFVLLAFMIQESDVVRDFLDKHLGLDPTQGIESVLFVLRQPPWKSKAHDGDPRFWNARGVVRDFLARLYDIAIAPIDISRRVSTSMWNKETLQYKYLYVKDIAALRRLVGKQSPAHFFRDLESTYVSELIADVRIRIRLKKNNGTVTFRELSEGEQQFLTVLGLLRFTAENESLFLLDEPDTHLNPSWSANYLKYLQDLVGNEDKDASTSHIVLTTHNPLAIAELVKRQVQILKRDEESRVVEARMPEFDPRGMGYAGIVTSDMFGLSSSLDTYTQALLEEKRLLSLSENALSKDDQLRLAEINLELDGYGFRYSMRDPLFEEYLRARYSSEEVLPDEERIAQLPSNERREKAKKLIQLAVEKIRIEQGLNNDAKD